MENGVVTVLYFLQKEEGVPSSHFMTFGTPSFGPALFMDLDLQLLKYTTQDMYK